MRNRTPNPERRTSKANIERQTSKAKPESQMPALAPTNVCGQTRRVPAEARLLDTLRAFPTPEHISFDYRLSGPLARAAAWGIDVLIRIGLFMIIAIPVAMVGVKAGQGVILLLLFILDWLSGGVCEWLWRGQTPGKRALGIQVIGVDGLPAGFGACMIRNILRWADGFPYFGMIPTFAFGLGALALTGRFQRLGDLAAGTLVIYVERRLPPRQAPPQDPAALALLSHLPPEIAAALDGGTVRAIAAYVARRRQFHPHRRSEMAAHLADPLRRRFHLDARTEADTVLVAVYLALFPADSSGGTGRTVKRPAGEANARADVSGRPGALAARVLARRRGEWLRLEALLRKDRGAPQGAAGAVELGRLYRATCTDLALAEAFHLPLPHQMYLHGLVAQAHLRFYRRVQAGWRRLLRVIMIEVPALLLRDFCLWIAFGTFFGLFLLSAVVSWWQPAAAVSFCGEDTLTQMAENYLDAPHGRSSGDGAAMSGFYIFNNVRIALACFASGIFLGVGSLVWLAFNGIFLGCCFGWMAAQDGPERAHFFEFVSAHGPFELTGIALAGAAGLRLGLGLVIRRGLPVADSLVASSRRVGPVLAVAAALVALAAPIEGWISPSALALEWKRALMWSCLALLGLYFFVLGWLGQRHTESLIDGSQQP